MANGRFGGGTGSINNPYLIEDAKDLDRIRFNLTSAYKLVNNINLDVYPFNVGNGWSPIDGSFLGILDGNGKKILNLRINRGNESNVGFFRIIANSATLKSRVRDLAFENAEVIGKDYVGIVAGRITYGAEAIANVQTEATIERVVCDGKVIGENYTGLATGMTVNSIASTQHWWALNNVKVSGTLTAKIEGSYYGSVVGFANNTQLVKYSNIVIDADYKRTIGQPKGYSFALPSGSNGLMENVFYDNTKWSGSTTAVTAGSTGLSSEDMKRADSFVTISEQSTVRYGKHIPIWDINSGKVPNLYTKMNNNFFILNNGNYYNLKDGVWNKVFAGFTPTREQADKEGIKYLSLIEQKHWDLLKDFEGTVELVNIIETTKGATIDSKEVHLEAKADKHTATRKFFSKKISFAEFGNAISEIKTI